MAKKNTRHGEAEGGHVAGFEESIEELELIVRRLEEGGGALESALEDYSKAIRLMRDCHARLEQAERKIEMLSGVDVHGNPITQPMDDSSQTIDQKRESRGDKRSSAVGRSGSSSKRTNEGGGLF